MSTPQQTPKGARKSSRSVKHNENTRLALSENEAYVNIPTDHGASTGEVKQKQKKKLHGNKKHNVHGDAATQSDGPSPRAQSHPEKMKATPTKSQAYAGPTFHQSPAASSLPIPKNFLGRSLPNPTIMKSSQDVSDAPAPPKADKSDVERPGSSNVPQRETTPLDFLFDAARKAKATPEANPFFPRTYSPSMGSPAARSPAVREAETQFPFEFSSAEPTPTEEIGSFVTPYKDRIEAVRSAKGTPEGKQLGEAERHTKTAALKDLLRKSAVDVGTQPDNPFNARAAPAVPTPSNDLVSPAHGAKHSPRNNFPARNGYPYNHPYQYGYTAPYGNDNSSPGPKAPGSNLRNIYSPNLNGMPPELSSLQSPPQQRVSTARNGPRVAPGYPYAPESHQNSVPNGSVSHNQETSAKTTPSAQQIESDLRRMLKIDLATQG